MHEPDRPAHGMRPMQRALDMLGAGAPGDPAVQHAAWVARCVGRGAAAPLSHDDLTALAATLQARTFGRGAPLFHLGDKAGGAWIVRQGRVELSVGSGRRRAVVHVLAPGDVDGDIQHLLEMPMPYTARAMDEATVLYLDPDTFEHLLATRHAVARRWLSSVAMRLAASQDRVIGLIGHSLTEQVARLLLEESADGTVPLPQRTIAAMLGVQRPSLNKILKDLERDGLIAIRYGALDVLDTDRLKHLAG